MNLLDRDVPEAGRRYLLATGVTLGLSHAAEKSLEDGVHRMTRVMRESCGYQQIDGLGLNPTREELRTGVRDFFRSPSIGANDLIAVYHSGHAEPGENELLLWTADSDPEDPHGTMLPVSELMRGLIAGTRVERLLLMLDTCHAGQGALDALPRALRAFEAVGDRRDRPSLFVVTATRARGKSRPGAFASAFERAVESAATGGSRPEALALDAVLKIVDRDTEKPAWQHVRWHAVNVPGGIPPFLRNPRHESISTRIAKISRRQVTERRLREQELTEHFLTKARGAQISDDVAWRFIGRENVFRDITTWLTDDFPDSRARVVTGDPGSGKSAVLGRLYLLSLPERAGSVALRPGTKPTVPARGSIRVAIHARNKTANQVLNALLAAAETSGDSLDDFIRGLSDEPFAAIIDALDEAVDPSSLISELVRPLLDICANTGLRLLLGTRRHLLRDLGSRVATLDLDAEYEDRKAVRDYVEALLMEAGAGSAQDSDRVSKTASAIAEAAGRSFLVASIATQMVMGSDAPADPDDPQWRNSLPRHAADAMREDLEVRLKTDAQKARDLLLPLAYARGAGLPWEDIWAPLATLLSGRSYTDDDLLWLLQSAGSYVSEDLDDGRSVYRLHHAALAAYLRDGRETTSADDEFTAFFLDQVPRDREGDLDWERAHPYALRHLPEHAAAAHRLDEIVTDPRFLVTVDPEGLLPVLHTIERERGRQASHVYQLTADRLDSVNPEDAATALTVTASLARTRWLANAIVRQYPVLFDVPWAHWYSASTHRRITGHAGPVMSVALRRFEGRTIAVTCGDDGTVRSWDVERGVPYGDVLVGHTGWVMSVAFSDSPDRLIAISGSSDGTIRRWDVIGGKQIGRSISSDAGWVMAVACEKSGSRNIVAGAYMDGTVRLWDAERGTPIGEPFAGHEGRVTGVDLRWVNDRLVLATGGFDGTVRRWDVIANTAIGQPLVGHDGGVNAVRFGTFNGRVIIVSSSSDDTVRCWDFASGTPMGEAMVGHSDRVNAVAVGRADGTPIIVTGSDDGTVRRWSLDSQDEAAPALTGHREPVNGVALGLVNGREAAVTTGDDGMVRCWDLAEGTPIGDPLDGHSGGVNVIARAELDDRPIVVSGSDDGTVRLWDLDSGDPCGDPISGHAGPVMALAIAEPNDSPVLVSGGSDGTLRVVDLSSKKLIGTPLANDAGWVMTVALGYAGGHLIAAVGSIDDGSLRLWDLTSFSPYTDPLVGHSGPVMSVAITQHGDRPLAVSGSEDGTLRLWDLASSSAVGDPIKAHNGRVATVSISKLKGRPVAVSGGDDGTVKLWDIESRQPIGAALRTHNGAVNTTLLGECFGNPIVVSAGSDGVIHCNDIAERRASSVDMGSSVLGLDLAGRGRLLVAAQVGIACVRPREFSGLRRQ